MSKISQNLSWGCNKSGGGSGDVTLAGNNVFTGDNSFTKTISITAPGGTTAGTISSASPNSAVLGGNWRIGTIPNDLYSITNKKYTDTKASLNDSNIFNGENTFKYNVSGTSFEGLLSIKNGSILAGEIQGVNKDMVLQAVDTVKFFKLGNETTDLSLVSKKYVDNAYKVNAIPGTEVLIPGRFANGKQVYEKTIGSSLMNAAVSITLGSATIIGAIILLTRKSDNFQFVQVPSTLNNSEVYRKTNGAIEYYGGTSDIYEDARTITTSYTK